MVTINETGGIHFPFRQHAISLCGHTFGLRRIEPHRNGPERDEELRSWTERRSVMAASFFLHDRIQRDAPQHNQRTAPAVLNNHRGAPVFLDCHTFRMAVELTVR